MMDIEIDPGLFRKFDITLAYLFGSRAKGLSVAESDFDIAVLFKKSPADSLALKETSGLALELNQFFPAELDVVSLNAAPVLLKYEVVAHGQPLYCENNQDRINFEVAVVKEYIDDQFVRDIYTQAMVTRVNQGRFS